MAVKKGDKLFAMKTDDLQKQYYKAYSEGVAHYAKYTAYMAENKVAEANVEKAQYDASCSESAYFKSQVDRGTVFAPMDGQVLTAKGDLTDKTDVEIKQGEELMMFGDPTKLRGELQVGDRDIQDVGEGNRGELATTSEPTHKVAFTVGRVVPLGSPKEGSNVFTVYATLPDGDKLPAGWRPGMTGEAKIDAGRATWGWIWTHRLVDFVRLKLWM